MVPSLAPPRIFMEEIVSEDSSALRFLLYALMNGVTTAFSRLF